ncbi:Os03g0197850 [Oryza sativa Japonica Group]|uniref:Os03g0197850 protein n=1 Tax=Oryza sativa subsp. japonica TaxID=39947 RepID=A0A0P0VUB5_ORYSJ|nr:hypothetical protein EE612_015910 [Oryza sativa]BAS82787.1 Os03g0197850 [Oryza sativa Japonica Group]
MATRSNSDGVRVLRRLGHRRRCKHAAKEALRRRRHAATAAADTIIRSGNRRRRRSSNWRRRRRRRRRGELIQCSIPICMQRNECKRIRRQI